MESLMGRIEVLEELFRSPIPEGEVKERERRAHLER